MPTSTAIRSLFLNGPAGRLEALLNEGRSDAHYAAVVCHPHPLFGGTLHNKVVFHTMKALNGLGFPVLRFNFRGAGLSEGEHDSGRDEREDVRTAVDWLDREFRLPIVFAGFSFGAATGLQPCCPDPRVKALIALGTPLRPKTEHAGALSQSPQLLEAIPRYGFLEACHKPKLFVSGSEDEFSPTPHLKELFARVAEPKTLMIVPGANHFFAGHLDELRAAIEAWTRKTL